MLCSLEDHQGTLAETVSKAATLVSQAGQDTPDKAAACRKEDDGANQSQKVAVPFTCLPSVGTWLAPSPSVFIHAAAIDCREVSKRTLEVAQPVVSFPADLEPDEAREEQPSKLEACILEFAHNHIYEYGVPADLDIVQLLEETNSGWTHSEISIAIQLLLLKGELSQVGDNGSLLIFPSSASSFDEKEAISEAGDNVIDRVFDVLAHDHLNIDQGKAL